jgi:phage terminase small subunit
MATKLTAKQERFCNEIASGKNQSDAYREAFDVKTMTNKSLNEKASVLANMVKIRSRIAELRKPVVEKTQITLESHLDDLAKLRNLAVKERQIAAAITAEIARGKAAGIHIEKSQVNLNNLNPMVIIRHGNRD